VSHEVKALQRLGEGLAMPSGEPCLGRGSLLCTVGQCLCMNGPSPMHGMGASGYPHNVMAGGAGERCLLSLSESTSQL
jgi:hypothetical protein